MSTLAEIEAAVPGLSSTELERLEALLRELRQRRVAGEQRAPTSLAEFAGTVRLPEDPLAWQQRLREEWG